MLGLTPVAATYRSAVTSSPSASRTPAARPSDSTKPIASTPRRSSTPRAVIARPAISAVSGSSIRGMTQPRRPMIVTRTPEVRQQEGDLDADEPGADDQRRRRLAAPDPADDLLCRRERLEVEHAGQLRALDRRMEAGAAGDQQLVVGEPRVRPARTTSRAAGVDGVDARRTCGSGSRGAR